jgi:hypothetical protein
MKYMKTTSIFMMITAAIFLVLAIAVVADEREPAGSTTSFSITTNSNQIVLHMHNDTSGSNWIVNGGPVPITPPYTYKDADSGIIFYLESDGRHITAINPDGKILWCRMPGTDGNLPPYSSTTPKPNPAITFIGVPGAQTLKNKGSGQLIAIGFNSRQAGILDIKTGDFTFEGQN